jgi:hypothetical protein
VLKSFLIYTSRMYVYMMTNGWIGEALNIPWVWWVGELQTEVISNLDELEVGEGIKLKKQVERYANIICNNFLSIFKIEYFFLLFARSRKAFSAAYIQNSALSVIMLTTSWKMWNLKKCFFLSENFHFLSPKVVLTNLSVYSMKIRFWKK